MVGSRDVVVDFLLPDVSQTPGDPLTRIPFYFQRKAKGGWEFTRLGLTPEESADLGRDAHQLHELASWEMAKDLVAHSSNDSRPVDERENLQNIARASTVRFLVSRLSRPVRSGERPDVLLEGLQIGANAWPANNFRLASAIARDGRSHLDEGTIEPWRLINGPAARRYCAEINLMYHDNQKPLTGERRETAERIYDKLYTTLGSDYYELYPLSMKWGEKYRNKFEEKQLEDEAQWLYDRVCKRSEGNKQVRHLRSVPAVKPTGSPKK